MPSGVGIELPIGVFRLLHLFAATTCAATAVWLASEKHGRIVPYAYVLLPVGFAYLSFALLQNLLAEAEVPILPSAMLLILRNYTPAIAATIAVVGLVRRKNRQLGAGPLYAAGLVSYAFVQLAIGLSTRDAFLWPF